MLNPVRATSAARTAPLESRLQSYAPLRAPDIEAIRACCEDLKTTPPGAEVIGAETLHDHPRLMVSGWVASTRALRDGRRQILHIFLPGDVLGLTSLPFGAATALSNVTTSDARPLLAALTSRDASQGALWQAWERAKAHREQQLLDQVVRLGRLTAYERTAHLLVELMERHRRAGLSDGRRIAWPLTQETLADVLGLSVVHVNRILQQLRRDGLIVLRAGQLTAPEPERLAAAAYWEG